MKKLDVKGPATPEEITNAYKASQKVHERERLLTIQLAQKGNYTVAQIAQILGRGPRTVARWIKAYRAGGMAGLLKRRYQGRKSRLSAQDQAELLDGLRSGRWKSARPIVQWLEGKGIALKPGGVYYWLKKLKGSWKLPRKSHVRKDPPAQDEFKEKIVQKLEGLNIAPEKRVCIWVEDEHRYGLISLVRRCWMLRGQRVKVPYQTKYQWGYVYGALEVIQGKAEFIYTPTVSLHWTGAFVEQLVATDPEAVHVMVWDRAGFHPKPENAQLPDGVRLLPLPPYSPELNPVEPLWDMVKREEANAAWETLEKLEEVISQALAPFWQQTERVFSLVATWLRQGVATFLDRRVAANST